MCFSSFHVDFTLLVKGTDLDSSLTTTVDDQQIEYTTIAFRGIDFLLREA